MASAFSCGAASDKAMGKKVAELAWGGLIVPLFVFRIQYLNFDKLIASPWAKSRCVNPLFFHFVINLHISFANDFPSLFIKQL